MIDPKPATREDYLTAVRKIFDTCTDRQLNSSHLLSSQVPSVAFSEVQAGVGNLEQLVDKVVGGTTQDKQLLALRKQLDLTVPYVVGALHEGAFPGANFDYHSNPAAAEGESLVCEMIRKLVGLGEAYSLKSNGLGKIAPTFNEVLLLCYHSTVYSQPLEKEADLVFYSNVPDIRWIQRALSVRNNLRFNHIERSEVGKVSHTDIQAISAQFDEDRSKQLTPHFLHYFVTDWRDLSESVLKSLQELTLQHKVKLMIDLSGLGIQSLQENKLNDVQADFVVLDLFQFCGTSSHIFFLKERESLKENLVNIPMEYLKTYADLVSQKPAADQQTKSRISDAEFTAHDYNIGFGNFVPWERLLLLLRSLGKKGIRKALETQTNNLSLIQNALQKQKWV